MNFSLRYLKATLIRTIKKPTLIIILLLSVALGVIYINTPTAEDTLLVALYCENPDAETTAAFESLIDSDCAFHFYEASSISELSDDVAAGRAECGYVFENGITASVLNGMYRNSIKCYLSSSSTLYEAINELVFAAYFREYCKRTAEEYMEDNAPFSYQSGDELFAALFDARLHDGSTFTFDVEGAYSEYHKASEGIIHHILIGFTGILLLLSGLIGLMTYSKDVEEHVLINLRKKELKYVCLCHVLCPLMLCTIASTVSLIIIGYFKDITDVLIFAGYLLLVAVICMLLRPLMKYRFLALMMIPFYMIGCLIMTPVFIDLTLYLPVLKYVRYLFIPALLFIGH